MRLSQIIALAFVFDCLNGIASAELQFNEDIRPLLSNHCFHCHGPDEEERKAGLRLDTQEGAFLDNDGVIGIVPGDPDASEIYYRIITDDEDDVMPPPKHGKPFTKDEAAIIKQWIEEGAAYETHWSYQKPTRPDVPAKTVSDHPIDTFVNRRLEKEGLTFSPEADRNTLARRLALDLTGLPPSLEELESFLSDTTPEAYERYVDHLLDKPAYGEHWARMWLDIARYADSAGYADDPLRTIWGYRDYVIRAFNTNMPFDQFTREQLAGDLLPNPTNDQLIATAFHRNTQTNSEGGTNDEEFRNVAVADRVNTTMATWMGTTMACAQCHTHKYDPITHEEYFRLFAIFNSTQDTDKKDERPNLSLFTDKQLKTKSALEDQITSLEQSLTNPQIDQAEITAWERQLNDHPTQWVALTPTSMKAESGADFAVQEDGSILVSGKSGETDIYTLDATSQLNQITAIQIEVLTDDSLENNGPGRNGNFVLNDIQLTSQGSGEKSQRGRFVRLELPGKDKFLHVSEVEVFSGETNLARKGTASQSTTGFGGTAAKAIDGITEGANWNHTAAGDKSVWWEVDLGDEHDLNQIVIWNRRESAGLANRLDGVKAIVLDAERKTVWEKTFAKAHADKITEAFDGSTSANFAADGASADFEQNKFGAAAAVDGNPKSESGWAVGGQTGRNHRAVFPLSNPLPGGQLNLRLVQAYADHSLGRFRISVTADANPKPVLPQPVTAALATAADKRTPQQTKVIRNYYSTVSPLFQAERDQVAALRKKLASIKPSTTVPVMREVAAKNQRKTHIHLRGSYLNHGDEVTPGLPSALGPPSEIEVPDRLVLAEWLMAEDNPLTARVAANRLWEKLFGIGIVATSEEFGSQGERPSHPELLDWLAIELRESGWDVKAFLKLIVTSDTYRQNSHVTESMATDDPQNRLLARGPRVRLTAEMVRDQALAVAGLLSPKMYGPPVRPPQPNLGVKAAFGSSVDWKTSEGEDRYRRGVYTTWRRSNPYPSMAAFDAPNREVCTVRRNPTNTPLQALVTLNDPVYIEAAQALARRMIKAADTPEDQLHHGFLLTVSRRPHDSELNRLVQLYNQAESRYSEIPKQAVQMATVPIGPVPEGLNVTELAALTVTANVLLNLDEALMKR